MMCPSCVCLLQRVVSRSVALGVELGLLVGGRGKIRPPPKKTLREGRARGHVVYHASVLMLRAIAIVRSMKKYGVVAIEAEDELAKNKTV